MNLRHFPLVSVLCLPFTVQVFAESRVVVDQITQFSQPQVVAALKSAMEKEGCHIEAEKTFKGLDIQEIKCTVGEEKVTAQVGTEIFRGVGLQGRRIEMETHRLWIKTSGGKKSWSNILDKETMDILRSNSN